MNTPVRSIKRLIIPGLTSLFLVACSTAPNKPEGAAKVRDKLSQLQANPQLASRAPVAIAEAELAVRSAEQPQEDLVLAKHLVLIADRKVDIAHSQAQGRLLEDQRKVLSEQREAARLDARTREADRARSETKVARDEAKAARLDAQTARSDADIAKIKIDTARSESYAARIETSAARIEAKAARTEAETARSDADIAKINTDIARSESDAARSETSVARDEAKEARNEASVARLSAAAAKTQAEDLQKQLTLLNAKPTERGLVVTLGDILFDSGKSRIKDGATSNLGKLAAFLNKYPDRTAVIEGHTDDAGGDKVNLDLSQRRADAVRSYLLGQGVADARLVASGKGESSPIAGNDSAAGRQQNRRVEVIIANTVTAVK